MTATPPNIAETPNAANDVLSEILRAVRLTGSVFLDGRFTEPFGVVSPQRWDGTDAFSHLRHVSTFHLVARGGCTLETADGDKHDVSAGDVLLLPFTAAHRFWMVVSPSLSVWSVRSVGMAPMRFRICATSAPFISSRGAVARSKPPMATSMM